ncbi:hypothetical protein AXE86_10845 [Selenomonas sp. oral taxon 136]|nr:hypothetical protein AXE86_10845 [Selenomonas sp. oral taxon 136]
MSIGEEAVARMDGFGLRFDRRLKNGFFVGVAFCGVGGTDAVGEVVKLDVQGVLVGVRVDGDGFDAEPWQAQVTRTAISPRLAMRILLDIGAASFCIVNRTSER